jgi:hypothetical protein
MYPRNGFFANGAKWFRSPADRPVENIYIDVSVTLAPLSPSVAP